MAADVKDIDKGWRRIKKELKLLNNSYTLVGIQSNAGKEADGQNIAAVGAYNEYGVPSKNIPARPFMRSTLNEQKSRLTGIKKSQYLKILSGIRSVERGLSLIGEFMTGEIKKKITTLKVPKNDPKTIRRKGSSNPLIDTGRMRASITHKEILRGHKKVTGK